MGFNLRESHFLPDSDLMLSSSISHKRGIYPGTDPQIPSAPYASLYGVSNLDLPPTCMYLNPSSTPDTIVPDPIWYSYGKLLVILIESKATPLRKVLLYLK